MLLEMDQCNVVLDKRLVLNKVSLKVAAGEIVAVVGHNGAGKTTLLKTIMGLVRLREGSIRYAGNENASSSSKLPAQLGIRFLPAEVRGVFASLNVLDNLRLGANLKTYKDKRILNEKIEGCLKLFPDLREKMSAPAAMLSGGQQQMLAVSIALMGDPKLLLLDEPSIGLAPQLVQKVLGQVRSIVNSSKLGVILVEQNVKAALQVSDRVIAIKSGSVIFEGQTTDLDTERLWGLF